MIIVGLTGGVACGKSTVARLLHANHEVRVIDADQVARDVVSPGQPAYAAIHEAFGPEVFAPDGTLDRAAMRHRVFSDPDAKRRLEAITHPAIRQRIAQILMELAQAGVPAAVVEAALLVETGGYRMYPELLVVVAEPDIQLARLQRRDQLQKVEAERIIASQMSNAEKEAVATEVLRNNGDIASLAPLVSAAWANILARQNR
jgi:dephospho-CoA kinase